MAFLCAHVQVSKDWKFVLVHNIYSSGLPRDNIGLAAGVHVVSNSCSANSFFQPIYPSLPFFFFVFVSSNNVAHFILALDQESALIVLLHSSHDFDRNVVGLSQQFRTESAKYVLEVMAISLLSAVPLPWLPTGKQK